jgi:hypothetical protein
MEYLKKNRLVAILIAGPWALLACAAIPNLLNPFFYDHLEPTFITQCWAFSQGFSLYPAPNEAAVYSLFYGPSGPLLLAPILHVTGFGILWFKVLGLAALLGGLLAAGIAMTRLPLSSRFVILSLILTLLLTQRRMCFWARPDPLLLLLEGLGLAAVLRFQSPWLLGVALAFAANSKIHAVLYFLPFLWVTASERGWREFGKVLGIGVLFFFLPFVVFSTISLPQFLRALASTAHHSWSWFHFLCGSTYLLWLFFPLFLFGKRSRTLVETALERGTLAAGLLCLVPAAKEGSGTHHFLPLLIPAGLVIGKAWLTWSESVEHPWRSLKGTFLAVWLAIIVVFAFLPTLQEARQMCQWQFPEVWEEICAIERDYRGKNLQMAYTDNAHYWMSFFRPQLFQPKTIPLVDAGALMEHIESGGEIGSATWNALAAGKDMIWVVPRRGERFSMRTWYEKGKDLFPPEFRQVFTTHFTIKETRNHYEIWVPKESAGNP